MTRKRYKKLTRALATMLHEYSKLHEGETGYNGEPLRRTSMKRENMAWHPNWDMVDSYEAGWKMLMPLWDSLTADLERMREV